MACESDVNVQCELLHIFSCSCIASAIKLQLAVDTESDAFISERAFVWSVSGDEKLLFEIAVWSIHKKVGNHKNSSRMPAEIITARYTTTCKRVVGKNARKNQTPNNFKETQENIKTLKIFSVRLTQFWSRNVNIGLLQTSPHIVVIIAFSVKKYFSSRKLEYLRAAQSHRNRQSAWCFRSSPALFVSSEPVFLTLIISVF